MKRFWTCLMTLAMLLALTAPACADLLWEPRNSFYEKHSGECDYVGRSHYANGGEGFVTLWDAPGGSIVEGQFQNGTTLEVYWQYEDWGCATIWGDETGEISGWVPMEDLCLIYDHISFEEEYGDQFRDYNGELADYEGEDDGITFWEYPGAAEPNITWTYGGDIIDNLAGTEDRDSYIQAVFVDENGLSWGFVGYMYGRMNAWVCLDDLTGTSFPLREVSQPELVPAQMPVLPAAAYVPYILVGAVVVVTAVLLAVFFRKRTKKRG